MNQDNSKKTKDMGHQAWTDRCLSVWLAVALIFSVGTSAMAEEELSAVDLEQAKSQLAIELDQAEKAEDDALVAEQEAEDAQEDLREELVETNELVQAASEKERKALRVQEEYEDLRNKADAQIRQAQRKRILANQRMKEFDGEMVKKTAEMKKMEVQVAQLLRKTGASKAKVSDITTKQDKLDARHNQLLTKRNALKSEWELIAAEEKQKRKKLAEVKLLVNQQLARDDSEGKTIKLKMDKFSKRIQSHEMEMEKLKAKIAHRERSLKAAQLGLVKVGEREKKEKRVSNAKMRQARMKLKDLDFKLANMTRTLDKKEKKVSGLTKLEGVLGGEITAKTLEVAELQAKAKKLDSRIALVKERVKTLQTVHTQKEEERKKETRQAAQRSLETQKLRRDLKYIKRREANAAANRKMSQREVAGVKQVDATENLKAESNSVTVAKDEIALTTKKRKKRKLVKACEIKATASTEGKTLFKKNKGKRIVVKSFNQEWFSLRLKKSKKKAFVPKSCFVSSRGKLKSLKGKRYAKSMK